MNIYGELLGGVCLPRVYRVSNRIRQSEISDAAGAVNAALDKAGVLDRVFPGARVAVTAGSREIDRIDQVLRALVDRLYALDARPFIVPAMGSHGCATADGQKQVLKNLGITEDAIGAPIISSMDTVCIGCVDGREVRIDKLAAEADYIIAAGRVKAHPEFLGSVESGLMKMLAVGLGKQHGATLCHRYGFPGMGEHVFRFGMEIIQSANILCGLALIENSHHRLHTVEVVPASRIPDREPELLKLAKSLMPRLPIEHIDVLVIKEMGKEISGSGADPNVTGHSGYKPHEPPDPERIVVLDLTEKSRGNASGVGLMDIITQRLFDKIDLVPMYVNSITCHDTYGARIPMTMPNDMQALQFAVDSCVKYDRHIGQTLALIKNTACLQEFFLSENALPLIAGNASCTVVEGPLELVFDRDGAIIEPRFTL